MLMFLSNCLRRENKKMCKKTNVRFKNTVCYLLIGLLALSNLYFYSKYSLYKDNTDFANNISNLIHFSVNIDNIDPLTSVWSHKDAEYLRTLLNEVERRSANKYSLENYIAIKYINGNTLLVQTTQNEKGLFRIKDMFFLDAEYYNRLYHRFYKVEDK